MLGFRAQALPCVREVWMPVHLRALLIARQEFNGAGRRSSAGRGCAREASDETGCTIQLAQKQELCAVPVKFGRAYGYLPN